MNGFIRGALGLALAATAGLAIAQPYGPPLAGGPPERGMTLAQGPQFRDDMPGPDRHAGPRGRYDQPMSPPTYDAYGFDRLGLTADGYDRHGYDAHGFDRYGFNPDGFNNDGYDRYGYDENGLDRYGRRGQARRAETDAHGDYEVDLGRRDDRGRDYGDRGGDRADAGDRYAYDPEVPSYGGAMQHFADPRCNTCRPAPVRYDCRCNGGGYQTGSLSLSPTFFYDNGGVGPIPDGGGYGGGGYVIMGGGSGAHASSSAYASSSSRVSVSVRGGGGHRGGGHGGCNSCGGHK